MYDFSDPNPHGAAVRKTTISNRHTSCLLPLTTLATTLAAGFLHQNAELRAPRVACCFISWAFPLPEKYMYTCCMLSKRVW